jgi:hypothetical protein
MFAVVNHLHFSKPVDEFQSAVANEGLPLLQSLPGFKDFYFVKVAEDRAIVILMWEDAASAQSGAMVFGPTWFAQNLAPFLASEQQRSGGEVLVSQEP